MATPSRSTSCRSATTTSAGGHGAAIGWPRPPANTRPPVNTRPCAGRRGLPGLQLVERGTIRARGTLGEALSSTAHQPPGKQVYDGDQLTEGASHWQRACQELDLALELARTDGDTARSLLRMLTFRCASPASYHRERQWLIDAGIAERFLPDDLDMNTRGRSRTAWRYWPTRGLGDSDRVPGSQVGWTGIAVS